MLKMSWCATDTAKIRTAGTFMEWGLNVLSRWIYPKVYWYTQGNWIIFFKMKYESISLISVSVVMPLLDCFDFSGLI